MSAWVATAGFLLAMGCERNESSREAVAGTAPPLGVMNEQNAATEPVVRRLTEARCTHEQQCSNVGNGRRYATYAVCMDQVRGTSANELNAYNCPRGIDQKAFDSCIRSLRNGDCNLSLNRLEQVTDCRAGAMCMR